MNEHVWWYLARSSGIVAWALATAAVLWGLALSTRALGRKPAAPWLLDLHRFLGGLTMLFVGLHLLGLWADSYVDFGASEIFIPFASTWRPGAVAWGIVAFYLLAAVEATSLLMKRIPKKVWHSIHLSSYVVYVAATVHLLQAGTDASSVALRWAAMASLLAVVFLTVYRLVGPGKRGSLGPARAPARTPERASARPPADVPVG